MQEIRFKGISKSILFILFAFFSNNLIAQQQAFSPTTKSDFWQKVQFGGGIGLGFGSGYTDISIAPSAIYNFNEYVALGLGAQYAYVRQRNFYDSQMYGGSIIGLFNPLRVIQLSAELEQLRVNVNPADPNFSSEQFWNTGLFLGAGYRTNNVTMGVRYNVLHDNDRRVYSDAFMPFVRIYF